MFDEPFSTGSSPVHRLDPRVRLAATAAGSVCLALLTRPEAAALSLVLCGLLLACSRPPVGPLLRRWAALNGFMLFLWLTVPLTMNGEVLATWGPVRITLPGVKLAALTTLKANAVLFLFLALAAGMPSPTMGRALERLHCPAKLVFLFLFTYRHLHVIAAEYARLAAAARLRGFVPGVNLHSYRTIGFLLGMVLVRSYDRSMRVHEAMRLRCFAGQFHGVARFEAAPRDAVFLTVTAVAVIGLTLYDRFPELFRV